MPYKRTNQYGGDGGDPFSDDLTETLQLVQITIRWGAYIDSITPVWRLVNGLDKSCKHGGDGGDHQATIKLESGEYISAVEGRADVYVDQLTFRTNKGNVYGPYGGDGGNKFEVAELQVGGFFGRAGACLDAIGFFEPVKP